MVGEAEHIPPEYAWMCADMQRFGNFGAEVPETRRDGSISAPAARDPQDGHQPAPAG
jgi:hypothetical protein